MTLFNCFLAICSAKLSLGAEEEPAEALGGGGGGGGGPMIT